MNTTIKISKETKSLLEHFKNCKEESYEKAILNLIDITKEKKYGK